MHSRYVTMVMKNGNIEILGIYFFEINGESVVTLNDTSLFN